MNALTQMLMGLTDAATGAADAAATDAAAATTDAAAATATAGVGEMLGMILPLVLMFVVFYFLLIRPQKKKDKKVKEMLAALKNGDLTVSEIADKLRYSSVAHLSAQFRAQTGMSPTEFRRLKGRGLKPLDEV